MKFSDYEITKFESPFEKEVIELLSYLWGVDRISNRAQFSWKFKKNPFCSKPVGLVALYKKKVVGFRGLIPSVWKIGSSSKKIKILSPADLIVDPLHRRKGLFSEIAKFSMELYKKEFDLFLNLSTNKIATAGYLKLGWINLSPKDYIHNYRSSYLIRSIFKRSSDVPKTGVEIGKFGNITISKTANPDDVAALLKSSKSNTKIHILKDQSYLNWRFLNRKRCYEIFHCYREDKLAGYLAVSRPVDSPKGNIVDLAYRDLSAIEEIISFIIKRRFYNAVSILNINLDIDLVKVLRNNHFLTGTLFRRVESLFRKPNSILLRPTSPRIGPKDWFFSNIDTRTIENWDITEICKDSS